MIRRVLLSAAFALVLGVGSAAWSIERAAAQGTVRSGPWVTSTGAGAASAGLAERAAIAVHALFVLERTEATYFRARTDESGHVLDASCDYEIRGTVPAARWWSLTAYGADDFLIPNSENRYSFNMKNVRYEPDGSFVIHASARRQPGNWLPLGVRGHVTVTLRLYEPPEDVVAHPEQASLPSIRGTCP